MKRGDCVGVVAMCSACEPGYYQRSISGLESLGYCPKVLGEPIKHYGDNRYLFSADSVERRVAAFHELLLDPDVKLILSVRGGYGGVELLGQLDLELVRKNWKPIVGYSDFTLFLCSLCEPERAQFPIHGPSLTSLSEEQGRVDFERTLRLLSGEELKLFPDRSLELLCGKDKSAEGQLVGGNLTVLCSLIGTAHLPRFERSVLFLEECNEQPYRIHRMFSQLRMAGCLKGVQAVLIGDMSTCVHPKGHGADWETVIREIFEESSIPVLSQVPIGHQGVNYPIPLGAEVRIDKGVVSLTAPLS